MSKRHGWTIGLAGFVIAAGVWALTPAATRANGEKDDKRDGTVLTLQARYYPWPNIAFFVRDSVNLRKFENENPMRSWRNQLFVGIDWDF